MENDQIFNNEAVINETNPQWKRVSLADLNKFPNNCIGYITTNKDKEGL